MIAARAAHHERVRIRVEAAISAKIVMMLLTTAAHIIGIHVVVVVVLVVVLAAEVRLIAHVVVVSIVSAHVSAGSVPLFAFFVRILDVDGLGAAIGWHRIVQMLYGELGHLFSRHDDEADAAAKRRSLIAQ